jgi:hypothetical protein
VELFEQCAREKAGMGEGWKMWACECLPHHPLPTERVQVTGACAPLHDRGKRAGYPDWDRKDNSTIRTVCITLEGYAARVLEWERKTGLCANCEGSGDELIGWSIATGVERGPCTKCGTTGKSRSSSEEA